MFCGVGWSWCLSLPWETPSRVSEITASSLRNSTRGHQSLVSSFYMGLQHSLKQAMTDLTVQGWVWVQDFVPTCRMLLCLCIRLGYTLICLHHRSFTTAVCSVSSKVQGIHRTSCRLCFLFTVNGLQARTFGIWTLLSSIIRCACAIDIQNKTLYHITLWTFVLALGHFLSEAFIYKTAPLTIGVMAPLIVASFSIVGMLIGLQCVPEHQEEVGVRQKKRN
uniref:Ergosterol biosynthesis 28 homolog n=1 Tax=Oncorhynchus mykiss TaxID=8022 RepID=A0A8C7PTL1_ONCMY